MKTAETIMSESLQKHKPSLIICSYSGGYDSMVATHKALEWARNYAHSTNILTISVDTQIHADGWPEYVRNSAKAMGAKRFEIWRSKRFPEWISGIQEHGFGYTKSIHTVYFRQLKEAAFRAILSHYKKHRHDRIMFITGMRRSESRERANTPESERFGSNVWCNPLVAWSEEDIHRYRFAHDLPENPFYQHELGSGDCLCNWVKNLTLATLAKHAKEAAKIITPLDDYCRSKFGYGYGEEPSRYTFQEEAGQLRLFDDIPNLCAGCQRPKASNSQRESLILQRMEWQ